MTNINNFSFDSSSPFRIKRPLITTNGFVSEVDPTIKTHLDELDALLGKRIFKRRSALEESEFEAPAKAHEASNAASAAASRRGRPGVVTDPDIRQVVRLPLTPKQIPTSNNWERGSLLYFISEAPEAVDNLTISEYIDLVADLSALKYAFESNLTDNWFNLDFNTKTVLDGYPGIKDYLLVFAFHVMGLEEVNGLKNFVLSNRQGASAIANYAIISAARQVIHEEQLRVPSYNNDNSEIVHEILAANLSLSQASFRPDVQNVLNNFIFNGAEARLIDNANIGPIPPALKPLLIKYIKRSTIPITAHNINFFLPLFLSQIQASTGILQPQDDLTIAESDKDFDVTFFEDDNSLIQVSVSAVKCAAQLYYSMVLGDKLDVFGAMRYFTNKYLLRGGLEIQDSRLRQDLQNYVFSNRFTDSTGKLVDCTREKEREMFYCQVFNYSCGQVTEDLIVNKEFPRLWKVLMLESARYLERAQVSPNPDSFVSRQNVMQAVEDLQYNLSTHCTGMANVITPIIYAELDFIIRRIFMHPEILRQVVPQGGTWWRVVETLYMQMKHVRPKSTVYYNEGKLGFEILRQIADYNPATFETDANFSAFISSVDAFITTQSILQQALTDQLKQAQGDDEDEGEPAMAGSPSLKLTPDSYPGGAGYTGSGYSGNGNGNGHQPAAAMPSAKPTTDEWDF